MPANVAEIVAAYDAGQSWYATWRKVPAQSTSSYIWCDLAMTPGTPIPIYYAATPLVAMALARSTDHGLNHGQNVSPAVKYLHKLLICSVTSTGVPTNVVLCDYLMYYPFIDMGETAEQNLTTNIALPRYPDGSGVKVMAVAVASPVGGATFSFKYTNQDGVANRVSPTVTCNSIPYTGTLVACPAASAPINNGAVPWLPLQDGDTGVRSIQSITFGTLDIGLIALVLVKPLANVQIYDTSAPVEVDFLLDRNTLPIIKDDAYLNMVCSGGTNLASTPIFGELSVFWE